MGFLGFFRSKRIVETENVEPPTLLSVPGVAGSVTGSVFRNGALYIVVPYECPKRVDARAEDAMKYLCAFGVRASSAA